MQSELNFIVATLAKRGMLIVFKVKDKPVGLGNKHDLFDFVH